MKTPKADDSALDARLASFDRQCRAAGLRLTPQRREIFRELARACDHPSAEALHRRVVRRLPAVTLDTVYRTLATLEAIGLVERVGAVGNSARFEADMGAHHHFVCKRCGRIFDVRSPRLTRIDMRPDLPEGSELHSSRMEMRGVCAKCAR